jgi:hypothetical protein
MLRVGEKGGVVSEVHFVGAQPSANTRGAPADFHYAWNGIRPFLIRNQNFCFPG